MNRRWFLRLGLGGAGLLVAGGAGLLGLRGCEPDAGPLKILTPRELRTFEAVAGAIIPRGGPYSQGAADAGIGVAFDAFLADEPPENVSDVKKALLLAEWGPLLFDGKPTTLWRMDEEARAGHWAGWSTSSLAVRRQIAVGFRAFVTMVFYDRPEAWALLDYPGPPLAAK